MGGDHANKILEPVLINILKEKGKAITDFKKEKSLFIKEVKEKLARTPLHSLERELQMRDLSDIEDQAFVLPDESIIEIDRETRFKMGEVLVRPSLAKPEHRDLIADIVDSVKRLDPDFTSVILSF